MPKTRAEKEFISIMKTPCERCGIPNIGCECVGEIELERRLSLEFDLYNKQVDLLRQKELNKGDSDGKNNN